MSCILNVKTIGIIGLCWSVLLSGCVGGETDSSADPDAFDNTAMLKNLADSVVIPSYTAFLNQLDTLTATTGSIQSYCDAIGTAEEAAFKTQVQSDWLSVAQLWQQTELWQLDPVSTLRNAIQPFDEDTALSTCGVDQALILAQGLDFEVATRAVNQRGLPALEYLLFNTSLDHTCPSQISETQDWNTRSDSERKQWRCEYALQIAVDLQVSTTQATQNWEVEGNNYRSTFLDPQNISTSITALSDALFYLDTVVKDIKVGRVVGLHSSCSSDICPEQVESPYAEQSYALIDSNLQGFLAVYQGGSESGFDDLIASKGFAEVNDRFIQLVATARTLIANQSVSLKQQVQAINDTQAVQACANDAANPSPNPTHPPCALQGYLKQVTDLLKTDFVTIVNTDLPQSAQSDND